MSLLELYAKHPYETLVPENVDVKQMVFKFNSPQHFFSWVQGLHELPRTGNLSMNSSDKDDPTTRQFTLSKNLEHAYEVLRETSFDPNQTDILQAKISELKRGTVFADEGYEIDIPEYLSGSERVWLMPKTKRTPTRIIDDTLIIDGAYNCDRDAETSRKIGMAILTGIYRRNVIPRKLVLVYGGYGIRSNIEDGYMVAVDITFSDLNGIAKLLHPASFRRVYFRLLELYPDLGFGYGRPMNGATAKGYISIDRIYGNWADTNYMDGEIIKFLGLQTKK